MMKVLEKLKTLTMVILKYLINWIVVDYCCDNVGEKSDDDDDVVDTAESVLPSNMSNDPVERSDTGELN